MDENAASPNGSASSAPDRLAEPVDREAPPRLPFLVIGVGASAGGLEAFSEFLQSAPADAGLAYVLIQHLPPDRESLLADILGRRTAMPVLQIVDGMSVQPNHVYVVRPGRTVTIRDGRLHLGEPLEKRGHQRPVDDFFRSLAEEQRERAVGVLLSGMGSNGSAGAEAIKAVGGVCIAQSPDSAKFPGMPRHLIESGSADFVLRPAEMPAMLLRYAQQPYASGAPAPADTPESIDQALGEVLTVLRTRARIDFTGYKKPTVIRRIQRRMSLHQIAAMADYSRMLRQNPGEVTALADDLMIHVTGFFRDPEAWEAMRERIIVPLVRERSAETPIRAWVTACSTGEEAYTLAMLLLEAAAAEDKSFDIKIFATDTAERTLGRARAGLYPGGIEGEISPARLDRFFDREDAVYRIKREVRELVVFAPQNLLQDPPFSRLDIVSCRNLLIYLQPEFQQRALALLHFSLREGGTLLLGSSETIAGADDRFEVVEKKHRIYRRIGPTRHGTIGIPGEGFAAWGPPPESRAAPLPRADVPPLLAKAMPPPESAARPEAGLGLDEQLRRVRGELQSTIEELQTSNEELKASSEETTSVNEELQSTNEELETSKEELQSLNEELTTVNSQLQAKMEELEGTTNDLSSLLSSTSIGVIFLDPTFHIRRFTPAVKDLFALIPADTGRPLRDLARKFRDDDLLADAQIVLDRLVPVEKEVRSDSGRIYLRRALPYRTADNRIDGVVLTFIEISELKKAEAALERAKVAAEHANEAKDQFLANVSHELRTPLSALLLWTGILDEENYTDPSQIRTAMGIVRRCGVELQELIEELVDVSRIASGKMRIELHPTDLKLTMRAALDRLRQQAAARGLVIAEEIDPRAGLVLADRGRLQQVVSNLLTNAIKFTPAGGRISFRLLRRGSEIEIQVADTGEGIPPDLIPRLFSRFFQAANGTTRTNTGLGLGLAISRQIVELHGGTIAVASDGAGRGATFTVRLPLPVINPVAGPAGPRPVRRDTSLKGRRILLVEDSTDTRDALAALLRKAGAEVVAFGTAEAAIAEYQQRRAHLILSDIGLPRIDGHELIRSVRSWEREQNLPPVPALALSAYADDQNRRKAIDSGFDRALTKPVDVDSLLTALAELKAP